MDLTAQRRARIGQNNVVSGMTLRTGDVMVATALSHADVIVTFCKGNVRKLLMCQQKKIDNFTMPTAVTLRTRDVTVPAALPHVDVTVTLCKRVQHILIIL